MWAACLPQLSAQRNEYAGDPGSDSVLTDVNEV